MSRTPSISPPPIAQYRPSSEFHRLLADGPSTTLCFGAAPDGSGRRSSCQKDERPEWSAQIVANYEGARGHLLYVLQVRAPPQKWLVSRTFKEFQTADKALRKALGPAGLPHLPPAHRRLLSAAEPFLEERQKGLQRWLDTLCAARDPVRNNPSLRRLLAPADDLARPQTAPFAQPRVPVLPTELPDLPATDTWPESLKNSTIKSRLEEAATGAAGALRDLYVFDQQLAATQKAASAQALVFDRARKKIEEAEKTLRSFVSTVDALCDEAGSLYSSAPESARKEGKIRDPSPGSSSDLKDHSDEESGDESDEDEVETASPKAEKTSDDDSDVDNSDEEESEESEEEEEDDEEVKVMLEESGKGAETSFLVELPASLSDSDGNECWKPLHAYDSECARVCTQALRWAAAFHDEEARTLVRALHGRMKPEDSHALKWYEVRATSALRNWADLRAKDAFCSAPEDVRELLALVEREMALRSRAGQTISVARLRKLWEGLRDGDKLASMQTALHRQIGVDELASALEDRAGVVEKGVAAMERKKRVDKAVLYRLDQLSSDVEQARVFVEKKVGKEKDWDQRLDGVCDRIAAMRCIVDALLSQGLEEHAVRKSLELERF